jgi:hypothetical protein
MSESDIKAILATPILRDESNSATFEGTEIAEDEEDLAGEPGAGNGGSVPGTAPICDETFLELGDI